MFRAQLSTGPPEAAPRPPLPRITADNAVQYKPPPIAGIDQAARVAAGSAPLAWYRQMTGAEWDGSGRDYNVVRKRWRRMGDKEFQARERERETKRDRSARVRPADDGARASARRKAKEAQALQEFESERARERLFIRLLEDARIPDPHSFLVSARALSLLFFFDPDEPEQSDFAWALYFRRACEEYLKWAERKPWSLPRYAANSDPDGVIERRAGDIARLGLSSRDLYAMFQPTGCVPRASCVPHAFTSAHMCPCQVCGWLRRLVTQHDTCGHIDAWIPREAFDVVGVSFDMQRFPPKLGIKQVAALLDACDRWINWHANTCPVCDLDCVDGEWEGASPWEGQPGCCTACRLELESDAAAALAASHPEAADFVLATALPLRGAALMRSVIGRCPQLPGPYDEQMEAWVAQQQRLGINDWDDWDDWSIRLYAAAFRDYGPYVVDL